jgi:DnaJ-class molecular chaperone
MKKKCPHCEGKTVCERGKPYDRLFTSSYRSCPTCLKAQGYEPKEKLVVTCSICEGKGYIDRE